MLWTSVLKPERITLCSASSGKLLGIIRVVLLLEEPGGVERARDERWMPHQTQGSVRQRSTMTTLAATLHNTDWLLYHMQHRDPTRHATDGMARTSCSCKVSS